LFFQNGVALSESFYLLVAFDCLMNIAFWADQIDRLEGNMGRTVPKFQMLLEGIIEIYQYFAELCVVRIRLHLVYRRPTLLVLINLFIMRWVGLFRLAVENINEQRIIIPDAFTWLFG
jgi:hypothetical protein